MEEPHLSASGSRKSSLSSSAPAAPGTTRPGVDVLTMGTDWEACSLESDCGTSEKAVTGRERDETDLLRTDIKEKGVKCVRLHREMDERATWSCHLQRRGGDAASARLFFMGGEEQGAFKHPET